MACRATGAIVADERVHWLVQASGGVPALVETLLIQGAWERGGRPVPAAVAEPRLAKAPRGRLDMIAPATVDWLRGIAVLARDVADHDAIALSGLAPGAA